MLFRLFFWRNKKNRLSADYQKRSAFFGIEMREDIFIVHGEPFTFSFSILFIIIEIIFFVRFGARGTTEEEQKLLWSYKSIGYHHCHYLTSFASLDITSDSMCLSWQLLKILLRTYVYFYIEQFKCVLHIHIQSDDIIISDVRP